MRNEKRIPAAIDEPHLQANSFMILSKRDASCSLGAFRAARIFRLPRNINVELGVFCSPATNDVLNIQ